MGYGRLEAIETSTSSNSRVLNVQKGEILAVVEVPKDDGRWVKVKSVVGVSGHVKKANTKGYESPPPSVDHSEPPSSSQGTEPFAGSQNVLQ